MPRESSAEERMTAVTQAHAAFRQLRTSASDERSRWLWNRQAWKNIGRRWCRRDEETAGAGRLNGELDQPSTSSITSETRLLRRSTAEPSISPAIRMPPTAASFVEADRVPLGPVAVWGASNFPLLSGFSEAIPPRRWQPGAPDRYRASRASTNAGAARRDCAGCLGHMRRSARNIALLAGRATGASLIADAQVKAGAFTGSYAGEPSSTLQHATRPDSLLRRDGIGQPCFPHASGGATARGRDCPGSRRFGNSRCRAVLHQTRTRLRRRRC